MPPSATNTGAMQDRATLSATVDWSDRMPAPTDRRLDSEDRRGVAIDIAVKAGALMRVARRLSLLAIAGCVLAPPLASGWQVIGPSVLLTHVFPAFVGVAATPDGDVAVVGDLDFSVLKLAGTSGQEIWRYSGGLAIGPGNGSAVAVDPAG